MLRNAILALRKIISKQNPFESLFVLAFVYLFVEVYYRKALDQLLHQKILDSEERLQHKLKQENQKNIIPSNCRPAYWYLDKDAPLPPSRLPPLLPNLTTIPRIIHQTWKSKTELPNQFSIWAQTCKNLHRAPLWEYRLWDDQDNLSFVEEHFAWFLEIYKGLPFDISRVDAMRYMVLYKVCLAYQS